MTTGGGGSSIALRAARCCCWLTPDIHHDDTGMLMNTNWQIGHAGRKARLETGAKLAKGKIVGVDDATRLLEAVVHAGDRVCLEGDNQKQADLLSSALLAVDTTKVE